MSTAIWLEPLRIWTRDSGISAGPESLPFVLDANFPNRDRLIGALNESDSEASEAGPGLILDRPRLTLLFCVRRILAIGKSPAS